MTNKTISINPQLFSMGGSKTRKNKEKKEINKYINERGCVLLFIKFIIE